MTQIHERCQGRLLASVLLGIQVEMRTHWVFMTQLWVFLPTYPGVGTYPRPESPTIYVSEFFPFGILGMPGVCYGSPSL